MQDIFPRFFSVQLFLSYSDFKTNLQASKIRKLKTVTVTVGKLPVVRRVYSEDTGASKNDLHLEDVFPVRHCHQRFHRLEKHGIIIRIKID